MLHHWAASQKYTYSSLGAPSLTISPCCLNFTWNLSFLKYPTWRRGAGQFASTSYSQGHVHMCTLCTCRPISVFHFNLCCASQTIWAHISSHLHQLYVVRRTPESCNHAAANVYGKIKAARAPSSRSSSSGARGTEGSSLTLFMYICSCMITCMHESGVLRTFFFLLYCYTL